MTSFTRFLYIVWWWRISSINSMKWLGWSSDIIFHPWPTYPRYYKSEYFNNPQVPRRTSWVDTTPPKNTKPFWHPFCISLLFAGWLDSHDRYTTYSIQQSLYPRVWKPKKQFFFNDYLIPDRMLSWLSNMAFTALYTLPETNIYHIPFCRHFWVDDCPRWDMLVPWKDLNMLRSIPGDFYWQFFSAISIASPHLRFIGSELLRFACFIAWNNFQPYFSQTGGLFRIIYPGTNPPKKFTNSTNPRIWGELKGLTIQKWSRPSLVSDHNSHQPNWCNADFVGISHFSAIGRCIVCLIL